MRTWLTLAIVAGVGFSTAGARTGLEATYGTASHNRLHVGITLPLASEREDKARRVEGRLIFSADVEPRHPFESVFLGTGGAVEVWRGAAAVGSAVHARVLTLVEAEPHLGALSTGVLFDLSLYGLARIGRGLYAVLALREDLYPIKETSVSGGLRLYLPRG